MSKIPGLFPPTYVEPAGGASNNPFRIRLRDKDRFLIATYAQELYEWKWRVTLFVISMIALLAAFILAILDVQYWYLALIPAPAFLTIIGGPLLRYTELRGHALTAYLRMTQYRDPPIVAYNSVAENMVKFYQSSFSDLKKTGDEMIALRPWAAAWVARNPQARKLSILSRWEIARREP